MSHADTEGQPIAEYQHDELLLQSQAWQQQSLPIQQQFLQFDQQDGAGLASSSLTIMLGVVVVAFMSGAVTSLLFLSWYTRQQQRIADHADQQRQMNGLVEELRKKIPQSETSPSNNKDNAQEELRTQQQQQQSVETQSDDLFKADGLASHSSRLVNSTKSAQERAIHLFRTMSGSVSDIVEEFHHTVTYAKTTTMAAMTMPTATTETSNEAATHKTRRSPWPWNRKRNSSRSSSQERNSLTVDKENAARDCSAPLLEEQPSEKEQRCLDVSSSRDENDVETSRHGASDLPAAPPLVQHTSMPPTANSTYSPSQTDPRRQDENEQSSTSPKTSHIAPEEKSGFCIGSIFGLDVGGTLAKLMYFEQGTPSSSSLLQDMSPLISSRDDVETVRHRERLYRCSASAKAVLLARTAARWYRKENDPRFNPQNNSNNRRQSHRNHPKGEKSGHHHHRHIRDNGMERSLSHNDLIAAASDGSDSEASRHAKSYHYKHRTSSSSNNIVIPFVQLPTDHHSQSTHRRRRNSVSGYSSSNNSSFHNDSSRETSRSNSSASENDWNMLLAMRQESLPDDLGIYAHAVGLDYDNSENSDKHDSFPLTKDAPDSDEENRPNKRAEKSGGKQSHVHHSKTGRKQPSNFANHADHATRLRKSRSMLHFGSSTRDHAEALNRFYDFARRLDSYREGVKDHKLSFFCRELQGTFHFIHFETKRMPAVMDLIRANQLHLNIYEMGATGGGAYKFAPCWEAELGIKMHKEDELDSLVAGMQFVLSTVVGECYTFRPYDSSQCYACRRQNQQTNGMLSPPPAVPESPGASVSLSSSCDENQNPNPSSDDDSSMEATPSPKPATTCGLQKEDATATTRDSQCKCPGVLNQQRRGDGEEVMGPNDDPNRSDGWWWCRKVQRDVISYSSTYPYMIVMIGTGVSILRVDGPRKHERVSGSTIGGGTYWGLIRLLTDLENYEDVMRKAECGDHSKVDMMVGDIYGAGSDALEKLGLPSNLVASSFGKLASKDDPAAGLTQEDLARALLLMITNNIGQVAYLNAKLHKTPRIYFVGNFLRQNKISQRRLSFAIDFWSKGEMEALFLEHEGYFGALGAFLLSQGISHGGQGFHHWPSPNASFGPGMESDHPRRRYTAVPKH